MLGLPRPLAAVNSAECAELILVWVDGASAFSVCGPWAGHHFKSSCVYWVILFSQRYRLPQSGFLFFWFFLPLSLSLVKLSFGHMTFWNLSCLI